jgi:hypothetical protein
MSAAATMQRIAEASPRLKARAAGFFWLMTVLTGSLAMLASGRWRVAANLGADVCYIAATLLVYQLLKPVNRRLSLLAAIFSLVGCALGALNDLFHVAQVTSIHFLFFGLHCLLVGYLILRSTFLPAFVGGLMSLGGLGWMTFASSRLLSPPGSNSLSPYPMLFGILGEVTLTLWLLVMGVNAQRWENQASAAGGRRS